MVHLVNRRTIAEFQSTHTHQKVMTEKFTSSVDIIQAKAETYLGPSVPPWHWSV